MLNTASEDAQAKPPPSACAGAFAALKTYDSGSPRGSLLPIDEAVRTSLHDVAAHASLEAQLVGALQAAGSVVAREYVCSKLALIGTDSAVAALAALLSNPQLATAARNALEAIPGNAAAKALRKALSKVEGVLKTGVIQSLAARRDTAAVGELESLLRSPDAQLAGAAAAALAEIGSSRAGRALRNFFSNSPEALRGRAADAVLVCAERLSQQGRKADAESLLKLLLVPGQPAYVRQSAERSLRRFSRASSRPNA
jgi:hypothetical protein